MSLGVNRKHWGALFSVVLAWAATPACGGSSTVHDEQSEGASGGTAGNRPNAGGSDVGRSGRDTGGSGGAGVSGGSAGSMGTPAGATSGGRGGSAGASCADERVSTSAFCPVSGYGCPLTLDSLRRVEGICRLDGEDGYYSECDGYTRFEWSVGFGENLYDLVFSTATGELVSGTARVYDSDCTFRTTTAGVHPPLRNCATCSFCRSVIDGASGAGGEGGAGSGDRCVFDADGRVTLP